MIIKNKLECEKKVNIIRKQTNIYRNYVENMEIKKLFTQLCKAIVFFLLVLSH